jgi:hypothetical protein
MILERRQHKTEFLKKWFNDKKVKNLEEKITRFWFMKVLRKHTVFYLQRGVINKGKQM